MRHPLVIWFVFGFSIAAFSQVEKPYSFDIQYYYGAFLRHNKNVAHLVKEHPVGYIFSFNHKTFGSKYWQQAYNYPDWGVSAIIQDFKREELGTNIGLYGHYNFYFLNRKVFMRIGQGIAYNTNPFDIDSNFKNIAYGSHLMASTYLLFQYQQRQLWKGLGVQVGLSFVHHSNGSIKAPNSGTNILGINIGLQYNLVDDERSSYIRKNPEENYAERIKYNLVFRGGVNEGDYINLGQYPFYVFTAFADKRLSYKHTIQLGVEFFISEFLKKEIEYRSISFNGRVDKDTDYKRASVMIGHEFRIGKFAIPTQFGYYFYWPYEYESRVYSRIGVKYYITEKLFGVATVKTHAANAENIEFGLGIRI